MVRQFVSVDSHSIWVSYRVSGYSGYPVKVRYSRRDKELFYYQHLYSVGGSQPQGDSLKDYGAACIAASKLTTKLIFQLAEENDLIGGDV